MYPDSDLSFDPLFDPSVEKSSPNPLDADLSDGNEGDSVSSANDPLASGFPDTGKTAEGEPTKHHQRAVAGQEDEQTTPPVEENTEHYGGRSSISGCRTLRD